MIQTVEQPHECVHCGKAFQKEKTLMAHMCEPKRRHLQKDEKRVQVGFLAFNTA
jgi:predicted nucleic acid-binding Zn ribbon protein